MKKLISEETIVNNIPLYVSFEEDKVEAIRTFTNHQEAFDFCFKSELKSGFILAYGTRPLVSILPDGTRFAHDYIAHNIEDEGVLDMELVSAYISNYVDLRNTVLELKGVRLAVESPEDDEYYSDISDEEVLELSPWFLVEDNGMVTVSQTFKTNRFARRCIQCQRATLYRWGAKHSIIEGGKMVEMFPMPKVVLDNFELIEWMKSEWEFGPVVNPIDCSLFEHID